jgi:hypothetical protein
MQSQRKFEHDLYFFSSRNNKQNMVFINDKLILEYLNYQELYLLALQTCVDYFRA